MGSLFRFYRDACTKCPGRVAHKELIGVIFGKNVNERLFRDPNTRIFFNILIITLFTFVIVWRSKVTLRILCKYMCLNLNKKARRQ